LVQAKSLHRLDKVHQPNPNLTNVMPTNPNRSPSAQGTRDVLYCQEKPRSFGSQTLSPKETEMNALPSGTTPSAARRGSRPVTDEQLETLAIRANGLADSAAQSLRQVLEAQTGRPVSNPTASTIKSIVRNIVDAAVAAARYEDATSRPARDHR
jgi:hypothetical protein